MSRRALWASAAVSLLGYSAGCNSNGSTGGGAGAGQDELGLGDGSGADQYHDSDLPYASILEGVDGRGADSRTDITPVLPGDECVGEVAEGELLPLNMLIMMDRSISMGDAEEDYLIPETGAIKWEETRKGLEEFLGLPAARGLGVGIDYFNQNSCDPQQYATPEVDITPLPDAADAVMASYDEWDPAGNTPLAPALEGALIAAKDWKQDNPGRRIIVVLVTDGVPNGCGAKATGSEEEFEAAVDELSNVAADGLAGEPSVPTWVLGIQGQEVSADDFQFTVSSVAEAGGGEPVIIKANDSLATEFADALERIRAGAGLPCSYRVPLPPAGEQLDLAQVNVLLNPEGFAPEPVFHVAGPDQCEYGGWYYDPPNDPEAIELCPSTCDAVDDLDDARFEVLFGCNTVTVIK